VAYRPSLVRRAARRVTDPALDWIADHDSTQLFVSVVGVLLVATTVFVILADRSAEPLIGVAPPVEQPKTVSVTYENPIGGYGFTYPSSWELTESGARSRLQSPNRGIVLSFGMGSAGGLAETTTRLVESLGGPPSDQELIGTRWDEIGGSRSLLTSGIGEDEVGRPVRYLAVAIRGEPVNYAISIIVPVGSSPSRLLPILEEIVTSFQVVEPGAGLVQ
jgi:hypothetical protein